MYFYKMYFEDRYYVFAAAFGGLFHIMSRIFSIR